MRDWVKKLREALERLGLSFEVEEGVRVHLDDVVLEVREEGGSLAADISISLPGEAPAESQIDGYVDAVRKALTVASKVGGELKYDLDTSLPGYPLLHITVSLGSPSEGVDKLIKGLEELAKRRVVGGGKTEEVEA